MQKYQHNIKKQQGAVLMIVITVLVLGVATLFVGQLKRLGAGFVFHQQTDQALFEAKAALIGWALSHAQQPGLLPLPDLRSDNNYDGQSDCPGTAINNSHLLGRLAWLSYPAPCADPRGGTGENLSDSANEPLWYAVSGNLVYGTAYPVINSDTAKLSSGWISVRDNNGALISDRVAAVVISAGQALAGQNRSGVAPTANNYLDSVTLGGTSYSNADLDLDFIQAEQSATFNDRLSYLTIEELMQQVEGKIANTARNCLDAYALVSANKYPWAAPLNSAAAPSYLSVYNTRLGRIPTTLNIETNPGTNDATMQTTWQPSSCFSGLPYWPDWQEFVFYQIAPGYQPGSIAACPTCLTLNGAGSHRALLIVAGAALAAQSRADNTAKGNLNNYLEGDNANADNAFEQQTNSALFNDRVVCVDGGHQCR